MAVLRTPFSLALAAASAALLAVAAAPAVAPRQAAQMVEVVVTLPEPSLAEALAGDRALAARGRPPSRPDLASARNAAYLRKLTAIQRVLATRIAKAVPKAHVRWRYGVVLDGLAVVLPRSQAARLKRMRGVAAVYPSVTYHQLLDRSPALIGAPTIWGPTLATAGQGTKIGIIDDGIDQLHPFFNPAGFTMPAGFPKGNKAFTTAKVIVARSFPPAASTVARQSRFAAAPFDPVDSDHATHVAGIAAGDHGVQATLDGATAVLSGIAPAAYLGNYKVLTTPTEGLGLDGNSPEIAAGIEAAVRDGMDVINLSIGEPEIEPARDLVVRAIDAAALMGVVPVVAAGNDYDAFGNGTIESPGNAPAAITVAAVTNRRNVPPDVIADFSSGGPTPISLQLKPDVSAPGVGVLSSFPRHDGLWTTLSGTSMAAPHVAGSAALLRQRHPSWTVEQIKSALVLTGDPVYTAPTKATETTSIREGGGLIDLPRADDPRVFATPTGISFGLVRPGNSVSQSIALTDAGGGAGMWTIVVQQQQAGAAVTYAAPETVAVPGTLTITATVPGTAAEQDLTGFVVLANGNQLRRIPYWLRVEQPRLGLEAHRTLSRTGTYAGNTAGKPSDVNAYRYPDNPAPVGVATQLQGPEQVFRVVVNRPIANFGVALLSESNGARITPRIVVAGDENRLVGLTGLPLALNPYLERFESPEPVAAAVLPALGAYDIVFDTPSAARAGRFTFRFWIDDTRPPTISLLSRSTANGKLRVNIADDGSGVDPASLSARIDTRPVRVAFSAGTGVAMISTGRLSTGRHQLVVRASDFQELKNMEDVAGILPNTRLLRTTFAVGRG
jgi:subtilisin family serine protease